MDALVFAESRAVAEKKILMCLLAQREVARLGVQITDEQVETASDQFRRSFGLEDAEEMKAWMAEHELDLPTYTRFMHAFAAVGLVQASLRSEIDALMDGFAKLESARRRRELENPRSEQ